jgi:hypothetical protein
LRCVRERGLLLAIARLKLLAPAVAAFVLLGGGSPSQAVIIPGFTQYSATLDVAGRYVVWVHDDTTAKCAPGQNITQKITVDMELGRPRDVVVTVTKAVAATSPAKSSGVGDVTVRSELVNYSETNYCDRPPQPLVKPDCGEASGDIIAALAGIPENGSLPIGLSVGRTNGGHLKFALGCPLPSLSFDDDYHLTLFPAKGTGMLVPLGITAKALKSLRRGKALARRVKFLGPCDDLDVTPEKARVILPKRHSCDVEGFVWMRLKRPAH